MWHRLEGLFYLSLALSLSLSLSHTHTHTHTHTQFFVDLLGVSLIVSVFWLAPLTYFKLYKVHWIWSRIWYSVWSHKGSRHDMNMKRNSWLLFGWNRSIKERCYSTILRHTHIHTHTCLRALCQTLKNLKFLKYYVLNEQQGVFFSIKKAP